MRPPSPLVDAERTAEGCNHPTGMLPDLTALGEHSITVDCDVLQADGGTRTASITGACVALVDALNWMVEKGMLKQSQLKQ